MHAPKAAIDVRQRESLRKKIYNIMNWPSSPFQNEPDTPVIKEKDGKILTLKEMFDNLGVNPNSMNVDMLDVQVTNDIMKDLYYFLRNRQQTPSNVSIDSTRNTVH